MTTPIYRGTYAKLEANKQTAINWMIEKCNEAAKSLDDEKRELIRDGLEKHRTGENLAPREYDLLRVIVTSPPDNGYVPQNRQSVNYFYSWEVGNIWSKGGKKPTVHFRLRKDKTVNTEGLTKALDYWATIVLNERQQASIKEQNQAMYESLGMPGEDVQHISIELSSSKLNECYVKYSYSKVQFTEGNVPLDKLEAVIFAMTKSVVVYQRAIDEIFGGTND